MYGGGHGVVGYGVGYPVVGMGGVASGVWVVASGVWGGQCPSIRGGGCTNPRTR